MTTKGRMIDASGKGALKNQGQKQ